MRDKVKTQGRSVFVVDGTRTPFLKVRGKPGPFRASDLAVDAGRALLTKLGLAASALDQVVLGCVYAGPEESNIARVTALRLGCGDAVPALTVQRNCASGMQALDTATLEIGLGHADLILAGGTEAMSHYPVLCNERLVAWLAAWHQAHSLGARCRAVLQLRPAHLTPVIALLRGLTDPVVGLHMGQTAEQLATDFGITRTAMDEFAWRSHRRLLSAQGSGALDEVAPIYSHHGTVFEHDDGLRPDTTLADLAKLRPVFDRPIGRVTPGNSAQVSDGAAMLLLASEVAIERHRLPALGEIVDCHWAGLDPRRMGLGPVYAMAPIMLRQGIDSVDIDTWEINEAFAAQVLACQAAWQDTGFCRDALRLDQPFAAIDPDRLNPDGGGIGIGHPVGASGARIVLHALKRLQRTGAKRGMASLCVGGGQGGAMLVARA